MRKKCLFFLLCMLLTTVVAFAGKESLYVLHEGFEEGIPATWTQECISGQVSWAAEQSGASMYPESAFDGNGLVALRNTTGQTQHFKTMLVTPVMDLTKEFQPILIFSRAQMQYAGDVDALYVYYRTSAESRWVEIGKFTSKTKAWETDTVRLTAPSATYQLAFEGVDQMGRGIALDEVIVRPMPTCNDPSNISADGLTINSAVLRWNGSLDTDSFNVVLSTAPLTDMDNLTDVIKNEFVSNFEWAIDSLTQNTQYYLYLQAYCGEAESEWVEFGFKTKNLVAVPYTQNFDLKYAQGLVAHVAYWTHGTSILDAEGNMEYMPHIPQGATKTEWYSFQNSTVLAFAGARTNDPSSEVAVPAGHYVYAATPELNVESVSSLKATFWGGAHDYVGEEYMGGLVVGVMTDPEDFSTFVAVDTVYIREQRTFDRFSVNFDTYQGEGKYIAFASNFLEKDNVFYMDELTIEERSSINDITAPVATKRLGARFDINADLNGNKQVQLIVARNKDILVLHPDSLPADYILLNKTLAASEFPYTVELEEGGKFVQVYMRGTDGINYGASCLPLKVLVPMKFTGEDVLATFEEKEGYNVWIPKDLSNYSDFGESSPFPFSVISTAQNFNSVVPSYPYVQNSSKNGYKESIGRVELAKEIKVEAGTENLLSAQKVGDYLALPEVENMKEVLLSFYMMAPNAHDVSRVAVGVMADPFDPATFDTVAIYEEPAGEWTYFTTSFSEYKGTGKFPAIMAVDANNRNSAGGSSDYTNYNLSVQYLDNILLQKVSDCNAPASIKSTNTHNEVEISWLANNMTSWQVNLYTADTTKIESVLVTEPKCKFTGLTPHTTYYYSVSTKCGEQSPAEAFLYKFTTECMPAENLPYIVDFEDWEGGSSDEYIQPNCWTMPRLKYVSGGSPSVTSYLPYIANSTVSSYEGMQYLYFSYSSAKSQATHDLYAALPPMNASLQELQMKFYMKGSVGDTLTVGVMSDPNDLATFDSVIAYPIEKEYTDYIVRFDAYKGNGQYIAFKKSKAKSSNSTYIDAIKVDYIPDCEQIQRVVVRNTTQSGGEVSWQKGEATQWEVLLTSDTLTLGSTVTVDGEKVLALETATTMPYTLTSCPKINTKYYVYVRAVCGADSKGEWSLPAVFKTTCEPIAPENLGLIDFKDEHELDCWTVGVREGTTAAPSRNTNEYLKMSNTTKSNGAYAIMPALKIDNIKDYQVSFNAHGGTSATDLRELTVGVISNPMDLATFTKIKTISLPKVSALNASTNQGFNEGGFYTVRFDDYEGDYTGYYGKYIMFISENGGVANNLYIKNIRVDSLAACMELIDVQLLEANTYDLTVGWENIGDTYQVQLLAADKTTLVADTTVMDTTAVKFAGLQMLTTYYAQVRQICGEGDTSKWSYPIAMQTTCPVTYPLPYEEGFESYASGTGNLPSCWDGFAVGTTTKYPYVNSSAKLDGNRGFHLYRSTSVGSYAVLPTFNAPIGELMISFDYRNQNTSNKAYFVVGVATDVTSAEGIDSTLIVLDSVEIAAYKSPNNVWYYYTKTLDAYTGQGGNIVLVAPTADVAANSGQVYLDNIRVEKAPTCFRPISLEANNITKTSLDLTWTPMGKETAWEVAYVVAGGSVADATVVPATSTTTTITGLQHSTDYDLYVRAKCGNEETSEWSDKISATTIYFVALEDAHWNFDNPATQYQSPKATSGTYMLEKGWILGNSDAMAETNPAKYIPYNEKNSVNTSTGNVNMRYAKSDSCALKIHGYIYTSSTPKKYYNSAYAALPEIDADYNNLQIRFSGRGVHTQCNPKQPIDSVYVQTTTFASSTSSYNDLHAIKIGTMENAEDLSTFQLLTEYRFKNVADLKTPVEGSHWEEVIVPLTGAKGKYIAFVADYDSTSIVYIDDVVVEPITGCPTPNLVALDNLTENSATMSWKSTMSQWEVQITEQGMTEIVDQAVVETTTWTSSKLQPFTRYTFSVRAVGDADTFSAWRTFNFRTPCTPVADYLDYVYDFETNLYEVYPGYKTKFDLPLCWNEGKLTVGEVTNLTYTATVKYNDKSNQYSRNFIEGNNTAAAALQLYNYHTTSAPGSYSDSYVILPEMNFKIDSLNLHFWMRAAKFFALTHNTASNQGRLQTANSKWQKSLVIGAIADISDMSTFIPLDTVTYSQSWTSYTGVYTKDDPAKNEYWEEVNIPLKDYAGKGRVMILYPAGDVTTTSYCYIDDLEIIPGEFCLPVTNMHVANITTASADLTWSWSDVDDVRLQIATDEQFVDSTLVLDTVLVNAGGKYQATNLQPGTKYYFRVQHNCSAEESSDWTYNSFTTLYAVRFFENFAEAITYPVNWTRGKKEVDKVFGGEALNSVAESITANWRRTTNCSFATTAISTLVSNAYAWLVTPLIDLATADNTQPLMLSFYMGLSGSTGPDQLPTTTSIDDKFFVAVSEDGGNTWKRENTFWWSDAEEDNAAYSYAQIPSEGKLYTIDLSQYIGEQVKLAFVNNPLSVKSSNSIYLANIAINNVEITNYASSICQWCDYDDDNFSIDAYELVVGETTSYTTYVQDEKVDKYTSLTLTVDNAAQTTFEATICEGEDYMQNGFDIQNAIASGVYKQKHKGVNKCDSVVVLNLTVMPKLYTTVEETICQGNYYEFGGVKYYTSTIISDTLSSVVTGCDSIVSLYLTVNEILAGEAEDIHLCPADSIELGKYGLITEPGTYVDTLQTALLCDSVATWNVFFHEAADTLIRAAICQGESYSNDVWVGLTQAGVYPSEQKTVWGCDSIVTLDLLVAGADLTITDTIEVEELPYVLNGEELLPVGTEIGVYTKTINLSCGEATVVIMVGQLTDINSVFTNSLALAPNLVGVGQETMVYGSFADDAVLEVYHTTGALVYRSASTNVVPGLPTAGVYMVTVKSNNQMYQSMLIVQ